MLKRNGKKCLISKKDLNKPIFKYPIGKKVIYVKKIRHKPFQLIK